MNRQYFALAQGQCETRQLLAQPALYLVLATLSSLGTLSSGIHSITLLAGEAKRACLYSGWSALRLQHVSSGSLPALAVS